MQTRGSGSDPVLAGLQSRLDCKSDGKVELEKGLASSPSAATGLAAGASRCRRGANVGCASVDEMCTINPRHSTASMHCG